MGNSIVQWCRDLNIAKIARITVILVIPLLTGCKTITPDGGVNEVAELTSNAVPQSLVIRNEDNVPAIEAKLKTLLARPLSADAAVQVALLRNAGLQAAFNELGIAQVAMVTASLPPSPTISVARLSSVVELEIERRIVANIIALATLPARTEIASDRFKQAKLKAAGKVFALAADVRRAYYQAVASQQIVSFLEEAQSAAQSASELMRRLGATGAVNRLDQARDQVFFAEVTSQLAAARLKAFSDREKLTRLLGLWGSDVSFQLVGTLPQLPPSAKVAPYIERNAILQRVDLQVMRIDLDILAKTYELTNATRFVSIFELSGIRNTTREADGFRYRTTGFEIEVQIPIFDFGENKIREAELAYRQALNRLQEKAVNVRSEAREAYRSYRATYDLAKHYQREILPLRKIITDEMLLRYNAMQIDVFQLLTEARQRINANVSAIEAQRDFWLSSVNLFSAVIGGSSGSATVEPGKAPAGGNDNGGH